MKIIILIVSVLFPAMGFAQPYGVDWYKIAGGSTRAATANTP